MSSCRREFPPQKSNYFGQDCCAPFREGITILLVDYASESKTRNSEAIKEENQKVVSPFLEEGRVPHKQHEVQCEVK